MTKEELLDIIARGEELREQGYDVDMMQAINYALLEELESHENFSSL